MAPHDLQQPDLPALIASEPEPAPLRIGRRAKLVLASAALVFAAAIAAEMHARATAESTLQRETSQDAVPLVDVIKPQGDALDQVLALPGNTQAFIDAPIFARTNGYLKKWYADIGAHVRQGALLAEIETPEVDQQLRQARADLATAQANLQLADITATRTQGLFKTQSVSQQERDNALGSFRADAAIVHSREADVARLAQLQSYEKIFAPFDGVVTARNTDIGDLIDAGASAQARELFHMTSVRTLRIYVAVPEIYARVARSGAAVTVTFDEFAGEAFKGTVVRNSNAIDAASRTLNVEVDVDNGNGRIMPGAYGFVHFALPSDGGHFSIPANTLLFRSEGLRVGVVKNGKVRLVPIHIGRDFGDKVEVISGLAADDQVILDPSDALADGDRVRIEHTQNAAPG